MSSLRATQPRATQPSPTHSSEEELLDHYPEFSRLLIARLNQLIPLQNQARANLDEQVMTSPGDDADISVMDTSADYFLRLANDNQQEILAVREGLERIQKKTYGICDSCENPIAIERLRRLPTARLCIECQTAAERSTAVAFPGARPKL